MTVPVQTTLRLLDARDELRVRNQAPPRVDLVEHIQAISAEQGLPLTVDEAQAVVAHAGHPSVTPISLPPAWARPASLAELEAERQAAKEGYATSSVDRSNSVNPQRKRPRRGVIVS